MTLTHRIESAKMASKVLADFGHDLLVAFICSGCGLENVIMNFPSRACLDRSVTNVG
jgi:hypothetical protein